MKKFVIVLFTLVILIGIFVEIFNFSITEINYVTADKGKKASKIPVLLYHHILPKEDIKKCGWHKNGSVLSVEAFEKQMDYLNEKGFYTATLDELQNFIDGDITLPTRTVVITFDDGYLSNGIYAYPIMKKHGFKGTIFLIGSAGDKEPQPFNPKTLEFININTIDKYKDVFDFQSHTYDLHQMDSKDKPLLLISDEKKIIEDITKSKEQLNAKYLAYPYGKYNEDSIKYLQKVGYEMAFTVKPGYIEKDSHKYELPRFIVSHRKAPFRKFKKIVNGIY